MRIIWVWANTPNAVAVVLGVVIRFGDAILAEEVEEEAVHVPVTSQRSEHGILGLILILGPILTMNLQ